MNPTVFTIGHSSHDEDHFSFLLRKHGISAICDVRSVPFSRNNPQFNRQRLEGFLEQQGIQYRFLGKELGARTDDPDCYENGKVKYDRLAASESFKRGLDWVQRGIRQGFRIALMCAEKDPIECHRAILVAPQLLQRGIEIQHILANGVIENHLDSIARLIGSFSWIQHDMFVSRDELVLDAYKRQEQRIAFDRNSQETPRKATGNS